MVEDWIGLDWIRVDYIMYIFVAPTGSLSLSLR